MNKTHTISHWLLLAAVALPLLTLGSPLIEVDDARYAQIPSEMLKSGDWVLPTLGEMPYVEKPPLWYWTAALFYCVFGVSESTARFTLYLFALLGLAGTWWLGSWLFSSRVGKTAVVITSTSLLWLFLSHNITLDMPLSALFVWTTGLLLRACLKPKDSAWAAPAAWIFAALTFLCKGLIALLLPGMWIAGLAIISPQIRKGIKSLISPVGILCFFALTFSWLFNIQSKRQDFFHVFFIEQHFQRYLTPRYSRNAPWWFYLAVLPAGLLPWTIPFLTQIKKIGGDLKRSEPGALALLTWCVGLLAFFSISHSKLATYILPAFPHACILAAVAFESELSNLTKRALTLMGGIFLFIFLLPLFVYSVGLRSVAGYRLQDIPILFLAALFIFGVGQIIAARSRRCFQVLAISALVAGGSLMIGLWSISPWISSKNLASFVKDNSLPQDQIWVYGTYLHGLPFYTHHMIDKILLFTGELHYAKRDLAFSSRFGDDDEMRALPRLEGRTFIAFRTQERPHLANLLNPDLIESWQTFGPWSVVVVRQYRQGPSR